MNHLQGRLPRFLIFKLAIEGPKLNPNLPSFRYYCKKPGHGQNITNLNVLAALRPPANLSNDLSIINGGALRNHKESSQFSLIISLEKHFSRLRKDLFQF